MVSLRTSSLLFTKRFWRDLALTGALAASGASLTVFGTAPAFAQAIDLSHGGQITVTAVGGFDWDQNAQKVTAYNQAQAVRGDVTVTADKLIAYYRKKAASPDAQTPGAAPPATPGAPAATPPEADHPTAVNPGGAEESPAPAKSADAPSGGPDSSGSNEIYRLEAIGNVHIFTQTDQAWGDKAIYDIDQATLVMTGHALKLTTPQDLLTARDTMEYYSQTRISIGRGNATVTTNEGKQIRADVLVGYSAPPADTPAQPADAKKAGGDPIANGSGKLEKVNAFGHVWVRTQTETITGDRGVYVPDTGIARIVGNVHITRGQNQLQGSAAVINMHTGVATMTEQPGARVSGLVVPNGDGNGNSKGGH
ncbi:LptA/OstA family protein [Acetobacter sicerae]|uniref:LptA/OstA family protein n=1 Tax=Acetobacter sicerae TaxID=85325 RepID=A0ABS8VWF8_9PROT|nr:LptA/OstA family protein [Acetobacter sicerae]MCE0744554.1 LptA/OstA family protein [Acetobacter sicerae]